MQDKMISITLWGNGSSKKQWIEWYNRAKGIIEYPGYKTTHIGIDQLQCGA